MLSQMRHCHMLPAAHKISHQRKCVGVVWVWPITCYKLTTVLLFMWSQPSGKAR